MAEEMFKTTLMGGFDKDDVQTKVQIMKDEAFAEKSKLIKEGKEKDKKIADLQRQLNLKNIQREQAIEEIRKELHFTTLRYHRLDDMIASVGIDSDKLCTYCWDGKE